MKSSDYVSSKDLAFALNISEKTVLKYLNILKSELQGNGAALEVKHGFGSYLAITDQEAFNSYFGDETTDEVPFTKEGRKAYVLSRLINTEDYINIYDLADELYVSPSLLRLTIKSLADITDSYHLTIQHSHSHGYRITGEEKDLRHCLTKECKDVENFNNYMLFSNLKYDMTTQVSSIIAKALEKHAIMISEDAIDSLTLHVLISINRHETANSVEMDGAILRKLRSSPEFYVMKYVNRQMSENLGIQLPEVELAYLTLHLNGKQRLIAHEHIQVQISDDALVFYNRLLRNIYQTANVSFFEDDELRISLLNHIVPFINRLNNDLQITKSSLVGIKSQFPYAYDLAVIGLSFLNEDYEITSAEIGYFALHLALSMEKRKGNSEAGNIAIICDEISGLYNMTTYKLNKNLSDLISTIKFFNVSEARKLSHEMANNYQLVLNTTSEAFTFDTPILQVSSFITDKEVEMIRNALKNSSESDSFSSLFSEDLFLSIRENTSKQLILKKLVEKASQIYALPDSFYTSVLEREQLESTEYGNRIAIPHPLKIETDNEFICIAHLEKPITWDKQKVQIVFLISLPNHKKIEWFMDKISTILANEEASQSLISAKNYREFMDSFMKI